MKTALVAILAFSACGSAPAVEAMGNWDPEIVVIETKTCHVRVTPEPGLELRLEYVATRFGSGWTVTCEAVGAGKEAFNTRIYGAGDKAVGACWVVLDFDGNDNGGGFSFIAEPGGAFARYNPDSVSPGFGGWHMDCD